MILTRGKFIKRSLTKTPMENEEKKAENKVGEMHKQTETMPDGKRYIIFYTFGDKDESKNEVRENV